MTTTETGQSEAKPQADLLRDELRALRAELAQQNSEAAQAQAALGARFHELAALTRHCEKLELELRQARAEADRLQKSHAREAGHQAVLLQAHRARIAELQAEAAALRHQNAALLASTSWRLSAPVRWVSGLLRRIRPAARG